MTQKSPIAPVAPKGKIEGSEKKFWEAIDGVKKEIAEEVFGQKAGKGGSLLKDSLLLANTVNRKLTALKIHYDIVAEAVRVEPTIIPATRTTPEGPGFLAHGTYVVRWFFQGELVYQSKALGAFDETSSVKAVHGALTCARTDVLFTMFQASTKSEEELAQDRLTALNRQDPRAPAVSITSNEEKPY